MPDTWDAVSAELEARLGDLDDRELVIVGEATQHPEKRGLLRRSPRPLPSRYTQVMRVGDELSGECVGSTSFGGEWETTPGQHRQLLDLGWLDPDGLVAVGTDPGYPNYRVDLPLAEAGRLARMCTGALAVLGLEPGDATIRDTPP